MSDQLKILADQIFDGVVHRKCPRCKEVKSLSEFGLRKLKARVAGGQDLVTNQSWCTPCRGTRYKTSGRRGSLTGPSSGRCQRRLRSKSSTQLTLHRSVPPAVMFPGQKGLGQSSFSCRSCGRKAHADWVGASGVLRRSQDNGITCKDHPKSVKETLRSNSSLARSSSTEPPPLGRSLTVEVSPQGGVCTGSNLVPTKISRPPIGVTPSCPAPSPLLIARL